MLAEVISAIGTDRFYKTLYHGMREQFRACQLVVQRFPATQPIQLLAAEADGPGPVRQALDRYMERLYVRDPFRDSLSPSSQRVVAVRGIAAGQIEDVEFRRNCFCASQFTGKLALIVREPDHALALSIYRNHMGGAFLDADIATLSTYSAVLAAALERHYALHQRMPATAQDLAQFIACLPAEKPLSPREATVCAHVMLGTSNVTIAQMMGISIHSVSTYRRRAYAKLDVSSQAQLCGLLVRQRSPA
jgi:DNA-binding CsgD family transcriptional regulator